MEKHQILSLTTAIFDGSAQGWQAGYVIEGKKSAYPEALPTSSRQKS
ncbi:hypothetical protein [Pseudomonas capsici]|nr:hypothetical protein [Pseudomonas capsici]MCV4282147.1 hypothetical protein [Pseudomonas capsici]